MTASGENPGGVNILRSPKWTEIQERYQFLLEEGKELEYWQQVSDAFWNEANKPWMDDAMARGDAFRFVSDPASETSSYVTKTGADGTPEFVLDEHGQRIKSIFGRELDYLQGHGYIIQSDGTAVKPHTP